MHDIDENRLHDIVRKILRHSKADNARDNIEEQAAAVFPSNSDNKLIGILIACAICLLCAAIVMIFLFYTKTNPRNNTQEKNLASQEISQQHNSSLPSPEKHLPKHKISAAIHFKPVIDNFLNYKDMNQAVKNAFPAGMLKKNYLRYESKDKIRSLKLWRTWKNKKPWPTFLEIVQKNGGIYLGLIIEKNDQTAVDDYKPYFAILKKYCEKKDFSIDFYGKSGLIRSIPIKLDWTDWDNVTPSENGMSLSINISEKYMSGILCAEFNVYISFPELVEINPSTVEE
jgi:hypothetical protein